VRHAHLTNEATIIVETGAAVDVAEDFVIKHGRAGEATVSGVVVVALRQRNIHLCEALLLELSSAVFCSLRYE
jgi:hypothetical protein